jgi:hypothetical protein
VRNPTRKLTATRCQCSGCGEYFNSLRAFDRHRIGGFANSGLQRRCLTSLEMRLRGYSVNSDGFWITETRSGRAARSRDLARPLPRQRFVDESVMAMSC